MVSDRSQALRRMITALAVAGTVQIASAQWPNTKITFECPGKRVEKLLPELTKATGLPLFFSPSVADDVVALKVQDAPVGETLDRIASTLSASWKKEESGWRLSRSSEQRSDQEHREYMARVADFTKWIQTRRDKLVKANASQEDREALIKQYKEVIARFNPGANGFDWSAAQKLRAKGPAARAMAQVTTLLDPRVLASIPKRGRIVYCTNPTGTQIQMPEPMAAAITSATAVIQQWRSELTERGITNPTKGNTTYILFDELWDRHSMGGSNPPGKATVATVAVSRDYWSRGIQVSIKGYDGTGHVTFESEENGYEDFNEVGPKAEVPKAVDEPEIEVNDGWMEKQKLTPSAIQYLTDPVEREPLAMFSGAVLVKVARARKVNMVAHLEDSSFMLGSWTTKMKPSNILLTFQSADYEVTPEASWISVKPKKPAEARLVRTNRRSMATVIKRYAGRKELTLEEQADVVCSYPRNATLASTLYRELNIGESMDEDAIRIYGSLTPQQRLVALNKGIAYQALGDAAKAELTQAVYWTRWFNLQYEMDKDPSVDPRSPDSSMRYQLFYEGIYKEPTFAVPNGIAPNALLKFTETSSPSGFRVVDDPQRTWLNGQAMTADEIANHMYQMEHLDKFPWMRDQQANEPPLNLFRYGTRRDVQMRLYFAPPISLTWSLQQKNIPSARVYRMSELPDEFSKAIKAAYAKQEEMYKNMPSQPTTTSSESNGTP